MLRVTTTDKDQTITLKLEGKLAGPWVQEVTRVWAVAARSPQSAYVIDLSSVTFIDNPGRALLATMHRRGARLMASDCLIREIVDEIEKERSSRLPSAALRQD